MSAESGLTRDKDGFLKCKDCPRRFLTELMFENHSSNQHEKETETITLFIVLLCVHVHMIEFHHKM